MTIFQDLCDVIIAKRFEDCQTVRAIPAELHLPKSTVNDIAIRYQRTGLWTHAPKPGRCPILSPQTQRIIARASSANPTMTARQIQATVSPQAANVSISTIKRTLRLIERHSYCPVKALNPTPAKMRTHLEWAHNYRNWREEDWRRVSNFIMIF